MKIEKSKPKFESITITIESQKELDALIYMLWKSDSSCDSEFVYNFIQKLGVYSV